MSRYEVTEDPRMGGAVERWHTWPTIQRQDNANHQWNVARILLAIYPSASRELMTEALFHDVGEVGAGDLPTRSKSSPVLRAAHRSLEDSTRLAMSIPWSLPMQRRLTDHETWVLKLADVLERWEFGMLEVMLGNQLCLEVVRRAEEEIDARTSDEANVRALSETGVADAVGYYMSRRRLAWQR